MDYWNTSPQKLLNWTEKGAIQLNKLIPTRKKTALQDGANSLFYYMYLDNEFMDIEHLCCQAHARAKFKYAYDLGNLQAGIFLGLIAKLYSMEDTLTAEKNLLQTRFTAEGTVRKRRKSLIR